MTGTTQMYTHWGMDSIGWDKADTLPIVPWELPTVVEGTFCKWKLGAIRKGEWPKATITTTMKQIPSTHQGVFFSIGSEPTGNMGMIT